MLQRVLFKSAVQLVSDYVLLAALAAVVVGEELEQIGTATSQDDAVGRDLPRPHLQIVYNGTLKTAHSVVHALTNEKYIIIPFSGS